jgi:lysophospholipase L1-like esterase
VNPRRDGRGGPRFAVAAAFCLLSTVRGERPALAERTPVVRAGGTSIRNPSALDPFLDRLAALERGESRRVRILWLGDSHVTADLLTGHARRLLQARFGDGGPGLVMPGNPWRYFRHDRVKSLGDGGFETVGLGRDAIDPLVGLWGVALQSRGSGSASLEAGFAEAEVVVLAPSGEGCLAVAVDGVTTFAGDVGSATGETDSAACARLRVSHLANGAAVAFVESERSREGPGSLVLRDACGGEVRVLGADLRSGRAGILVDSVGINGAEIGMLGRADRELRRKLLERLDPGLVVVSFGTNEMGRPDLLGVEYEAAAVGLLRTLREDLPAASVLVTGPVDRGSRKRRLGRLLAVNEPLVIRALRSASDATGCAFVDQRALMGGEGSIRAWARRGLAARDLVHLSRAGYERLAEALVERLLRAYDERNRPGAAAP